MNYRRTAAGIMCMMLIMGTGCGNKTAEITESAANNVAAGAAETSAESAEDTVQAEIAEAPEDMQKIQEALTELTKNIAKDKLDIGTTNTLADFMCAWDTAWRYRDRDDNVWINYARKLYVKDYSKKETQTDTTVITGSKKYSGTRRLTEETNKGEETEYTMMYTDTSDNTGYYRHDTGNADTVKFKFRTNKNSGQDNESASVSDNTDIETVKTAYADEISDFADRIKTAEHTANKAEHSDRYTFTVRYPASLQEGFELTEAEKDAISNGTLTVDIYNGRITQLDYLFNAQGEPKEEIHMTAQYNLSDLAIDPPADAGSYPNAEDIDGKSLSMYDMVYWLQLADQQAVTK